MNKALISFSIFLRESWNLKPASEKAEPRGGCTGNLRFGQVNHSHWRIRRGRAPEGATACPAAPEIYVNMHEAEEDGQEVDAYSYSSQQDTGTGLDGLGDVDNSEAPDWLMEATVDLSQDLETSKKELEIIRFILQEMELRSRTDRRQTNLAQEGQIKTMKACREYSSSRCDLLRDRLRQVQFWAHARMLGQQVPGKTPDEVSSVTRPV